MALPDASPPGPPPRAPARRPPRWRPLAWALLLPTAALAGLFAAGELTGWRVLAGPAERWLQQQLQRRVQLSHAAPEDFELRLWRGIRLQARALRIEGAAWDGGLPLFEARALRVQARWRALLAWRPGEPLPLQAITADWLQARLVRRDDGQTNWQREGASPAPPVTAASSPAPAVPAQLQLPVRLELLAARDGHLTWVDAPEQSMLAVRFSLQADAGQPAAGGSPGPRLQASADGRFRGLPVVASLRTGPLGPWLDGTPGDAALALAGQGSVGRARLAFDGALQMGPQAPAGTALGLPRLQGQFELSGPSLAAVGQPLGVTLPTTAAFRMQGQLALQQALWSVVVQQATIGASRFDGAFQYSGARRPRPQLAGRLHASRLLLADLGPAIGTRGGGEGSDAPAPAPRPGRVLPDRRFDLPALRAMDADVQLRLDSLDFGTPSLQPAAPLNARLRLDDGVLVLDDLEARLAQGRIQGRIALDGRGERALWQAALDGRGLRLEQWIRAVQRPGEPPYAGGLLGGRLRLAGRGRSTAELLASAEGAIDLHWSQGQISHLLVEAAGLDIAQGLGVLLRGDDPLAVHCGMANLQVQDGLVRPRAAVVETRDSRLSLEGSLSLADERLALRARVQPRDHSPLALRAPLLIEGTLAAPSLRLDRAALARRVLPAALLAMAHPLAALLPLVDLGEGSAVRDCRSLLAELGGPAAAGAASGAAGGTVTGAAGGTTTGAASSAVTRASAGPR